MIKKLFAALALLAGISAVVGGGGCVIGLSGEWIRHPGQGELALMIGIGLFFFVCGAWACKSAIRVLNERRPPKA